MIRKKRVGTFAMAAAPAAVTGGFYCMNQGFRAGRKRVLILFKIGEHDFPLPILCCAFGCEENPGWRFL